MNRPIKQSWLLPFAHTQELTAQEYEIAFYPHLPRRTAINRLNRMREEGLLERLGQTRATIYRLCFAGKSRLGITYSGHETDTARVREDETDLRVQLRRPMMERKSVGYNRAFLDDYVPNVTYYLSEPLRMKLLSIGSQTGMVAEAAGTYARHICQRLLIDLSWNSSRLEGNTYSLLETEQLLQIDGEKNGLLSTEAIMILNHKAAIEFLLESLSVAAFDRRTILNLHALLSADLLRDPSSEGSLRTTPVGIGRSTYSPLAIPALIESLFDQILQKASQIEDPYEQAFFAMVHLPYLQPFIDGNKRVSRLAANIPLFQKNLAPLSFVDVSEIDYTDAVLAVYELNDISLLREVFVQACERSAARYTVISGVVGQPDPFRIKYRPVIIEQVAEIIRHHCTRPEAVTRLRQFAENSVIESDRKHFVAAVEETLSGIHEGNFARYRVRPSEFDSWHAVWTGAVKG
jgi:fido (protein-threonine AMPylation protein)